jgi:glycosyltransferase involved in cell wall biosynthesis
MTNEPIKLFHPGLKDLLLIDRYYPEEKIGYLSIETKLPNWFKNLTTSIPNYAIGLNLRREYRHIAMGIRVLKLKDCQILLIFEAYNQHLIILLLLLVLSGKKVLIMLHGNQQFAMTSKLKYLGFLYLKNFLNIFKNIKVVLLELDDKILPQKFQLPPHSKLLIPHPIVSTATPRLQPGERLSANTKLKIGVVGTIRQDKPSAKLIETIQKYLASNSQYELIIGTPFGQKPVYLNELKVTLYDTTKEEDYFRVLKQIDILVIHYDKNRYYYRTSGVISDAAACGCYIIASDYPVIKHQISSPIAIGSTFNNFNELESLIDRARIHILEKGQDNHWLWRESRAIENIAKILIEEKAEGFSK